MQEPDRALQMYQDALPLAPHSAALFEKLGNAQTAAHSFRAAAAEFGKAVRLAPGDGALRLKKVSVLLRLRAHELAAAELDECDAVTEVCCAGLPRRRAAASAAGFACRSATLPARE